MHAFAVTDDGRAYAWGANDFGELADGTGGRCVPRLLTVPVATGIGTVRRGRRRPQLSRSRRTAPCSRGATKQLRRARRRHPVEPLDAGARPRPRGRARRSPPDTSIPSRSGATAPCGAWGYNYRGAPHGLGNLENVFVPTQVPGLSGIVAIAAGAVHSLALAADGTLWAWGGNGVGQLGDGNDDRPLVPRGGSGIAGVRRSPRGEHSIALRSDGTVWAWGENYSGELGDGTNTPRATRPSRASPESPRSPRAARSRSPSETTGRLAWGANWAGSSGTARDSSKDPGRGGGLAGTVATRGAERRMALKSEGTGRPPGATTSMGASGTGRSRPGHAGRRAARGRRREAGDATTGSSTSIRRSRIRFPPRVPVFLSSPLPPRCGHRGPELPRPGPRHVGERLRLRAGAGEDREVRRDGARRWWWASAPPRRLEGGRRGLRAGPAQRVGATAAGLPFEPPGLRVGGAFLARPGRAGDQRGDHRQHRRRHFLRGLRHEREHDDQRRHQPQRGLGARHPGCKPQSPQTGWWWNHSKAVAASRSNPRETSSSWQPTSTTSRGVRPGTWRPDPPRSTGRSSRASSRASRTARRSTARSDQMRPADARPITLTFGDAQHGTLAWPGGTVAIERRIRHRRSERPRRGPAGERMVAGRRRITAAASSSSGRAGVAFVAGYMYDADGAPRGTWPTLPASAQTFSGTGCSSSTDRRSPAPIARPRPSTARRPGTIQFQGADTALLTLPSGTLPITRFRF